jgi:hypothetical protein
MQTDDQWDITTLEQLGGIMIAMIYTLGTRMESLLLRRFSPLHANLTREK